MGTLLRYYSFSLGFTLVCLALGAWYGYATTGSLAGMAGIFWIVLVLAILEVSLSFDNAVVNATVLKDMDPVWQRRFLIWGIAIAVFGTRIVFPVAIVAITAGLGPIEAVRLSLDQPQEYEAIVSSARYAIAGFGGAFLAMVGLNFFFSEEKDIHWIRVIEQRIARLAVLPAVEIALLLVILWAVSLALPQEQALTFLVAGVLGLVTHICVGALSRYLELREDQRRLAGHITRSGLGGFLYLEVLDASFSFDGVIGAFALSNNMVVIAIGLSIGAVFVRSITIHLVRQGTLTHYRYLEHGAFWAILALAAIMLISPLVHMPETVTGLIGVTLIGLSFWWSVRHNRRGQDGVTHPEVITPG